MKRRPAVPLSWGSTLPWRIPTSDGVPRGCLPIEFTSAFPVCVQLDCYLTGIAHADGSSIALEAALGSNARVDFEIAREETNARDRHAIIVRVPRGAAVGYVASAYASVISPLLDSGLVQIWLQARRPDVVAALGSPKLPMRLTGFVRLESQTAAQGFHDTALAADSATKHGLPLGEPISDAQRIALRLLHQSCFQELEGIVRPAPVLREVSQSGLAKTTSSRISGLQQRSCVNSGASSDPLQPTSVKQGFVSAKLAMASQKGTTPGAGTPAGGFNDGSPSEVEPYVGNAGGSLQAASSRALKKSRQGSLALQSAFARGSTDQLTLTGLSALSRRVPAVEPRCADGSTRLGALARALPGTVLERIFSAPGITMFDLLRSFRAVCKSWRDTIDGGCTRSRVLWARSASTALQRGDVSGWHPDELSCTAAPPGDLLTLLDFMSYHELPSSVAYDVWRAALPVTESAALCALAWDSIARCEEAAGMEPGRGTFARYSRAGSAAIPMLALSLVALPTRQRIKIIDAFFRAALGSLETRHSAALHPGLVCDALHRLALALHARTWAFGHLPPHFPKELHFLAERHFEDSASLGVQPTCASWYCSLSRPPVSRAALDILTGLRSFQNPHIVVGDLPRGAGIVVAGASQGAAGVGRSTAFTEEQVAVIKSEPGAAGIIKVIAFAGTGKTTTLAAYARARPSRRFLYIVFNVSVREESTRKFPPNVQVTNIHRLAFSAVGWKYSKVMRPCLVAPDVMKLLDIDGEADAHVIAASVVATLEAFFSSSDYALGAQHLPAYANDSTPGVAAGKANADRVTHAPTSAAAKPCSFYTVACAGASTATTSVLARAERLWELMRNSCSAASSTGGGCAPYMTHAGYLKLYQLSRPDLSRTFDYLLCDEAQDLAPTVVSIVLAQHCPVLLVGDPHQAIYGFLGATDTLSSNSLLELRRSAQAGSGTGGDVPVGIEPRVISLRLTRSFRFGAEIAAAASVILRQFKACADPVLGRPDTAKHDESSIVLFPLAPASDPREESAFQPRDATLAEHFERRSPVSRAYSKRPLSHSLAHSSQRANTVATLARSNAGALEAAAGLARRGARLAFIGGLDGYGLDSLVDVALLEASQSDPAMHARIKGTLVRSFATATALRAYAERVRDAELGGCIRMMDRWGGAAAVMENVDLIRGATVSAALAGTVGGTPDVHVSTVHKAKGLEFDEVRRLRGAVKPCKICAYRYVCRFSSSVTLPRCCKPLRRASATTEKSSLARPRRILRKSTLRTSR